LPFKAANKIYMRYFLCGVKMVDEILGQRRTDEASVKRLLTRKKRLEIKLSLCARNRLHCQWKSNMVTAEIQRHSF
jgi:hypothetical protein